MNKAAKLYWENFWQCQTPPSTVVAETFGDSPQLADEIATLIVSGKKTATCSSHALYQLEGHPLPIIGFYTIVLDGDDQPVAIIKTTNVQLIEMNKVPAELAAKEGEGDLSLAYWYSGHKNYFTRALAEFGLEFSDDMFLVFEIFEVVDVRKASNATV